MKQAINILAIVTLSISILTITHAQIVRDDEGTYVTRNEFTEYSSSFTQILSTLEKAGQAYVQNVILPSYEADGRLDSIVIWRTATQSGTRVKEEETTNGGN